MELSATYAYKVYQERSFSAAAKALFISQPALSAAISRLERELNFKIFDRTTVPLSLTAEGKIYIESLEEIIESEVVMRQRIRQLSDMSYGSLSVGGSSQAAYHFFSVVCEEFHKCYPNIEVRLDIGNVGARENLQEKIKKHTLDLAVGYEYSEPEYEITPLFEEQFIIAMHKNLEGADKFIDYAVSREEIINKTCPEKKKIKDLHVFQDVRFLKFNKSANTTKKMSELIGDYKVSRYSIENVRHGGLHYNMMRRGLGALMTTDTIIRITEQEVKDILFFVPAMPESKRTLCIARERHLPKNPISENFISLGVEICKNGKLFE